jgi:hypothetical protein
VAFKTNGNSLFSNRRSVDLYAFIDEQRLHVGQRSRASQGIGCRHACLYVPYAGVSRDLAGGESGLSCVRKIVPTRTGSRSASAAKCDLFCGAMASCVRRRTCETILFRVSRCRRFQVRRFLVPPFGEYGRTLRTHDFIQQSSDGVGRSCCGNGCCPFHILRRPSVYLPRCR